MALLMLENVDGRFRRLDDADLRELLLEDFFLAMIKPKFCSNYSTLKSGNLLQAELSLSMSKDPHKYECNQKETA